MKKLLTEYYPLRLDAKQLNEAVESQPGSPMIIKNVILQRANAFNRNKRRYTKDVLNREMERYGKEFIDNNRALGELDHPASDRADGQIVILKNVCLNIKRWWWDGDDVMGDIEILDSPEFPSGRIIAGLLRRGIPVGISSRGMGSVIDVDDEEGAVEVDDDFSLICFDGVSYESTQQATMNLSEGVGATNTKEKYDRVDSLIYELICNNSGACSCMFDKK